MLKRSRGAGDVEKHERRRGRVELAVQPGVTRMLGLQQRFGERSKKLGLLRTVERCHGLIRKVLASARQLARVLECEQRQMQQPQLLESVVLGRPLEVKVTAMDRARCENGQRE